MVYHSGGKLSVSITSYLNTLKLVKNLKQDRIHWPWPWLWCKSWQDLWKQPKHGCNAHNSSIFLTWHNLLAHNYFVLQCSSKEFCQSGTLSVVHSRTNVVVSLWKCGPVLKKKQQLGFTLISTKSTEGGFPNLLSFSPFLFNKSRTVVTE